MVGELGPDGCIYAVPGSARSVLRIQPTANAPLGSGGGMGEHALGYKLSMVGSLCGPTVQSSMGKNRFKWLRGALARDGCIYGIPSNADCVLRIVTGRYRCKPAGPVAVIFALVHVILGLHFICYTRACSRSLPSTHLVTPCESALGMRGHLASACDRLIGYSVFNHYDISTLTMAHFQ